MTGQRAAGRGRRDCQRPALVVLLALILSLLSGGRATSAERRAEQGPSTTTISAPVATTPAVAKTARKPWETRDHRRKPTTSATPQRTRNPWETRGHPRNVPTPREGSANGPRAP